MVMNSWSIPWSFCQDTTGRTTIGRTPNKTDRADSKGKSGPDKVRRLVCAKKGSERVRPKKEIRCPYCVTVSRYDKKTPTITCENIENNLGFEVRNKLEFTSHEEKKNYQELFCADMYDTCPYYKAIYQREKEGK